MCKTSLLPTGAKVEMLCRLHMFASNQSKEDRCKQLGRRGSVKSNLKQGKAQRAIEEGVAFDDDADDEIKCYIFYAATGMEVTEERRRSSATVFFRRNLHHRYITSPITNPDNIVPNVKGERVVTIYDSTESNY